MNFSLDQRMQDTINRISERGERPVLPPARRMAIISPRIPKTPEYYTEMAKKAGEANEPYIRSLYLRCAKLAKEGKHREITDVLNTGIQTFERRNPALAVPAPAVPALVAPAPAVPAPVRRVRQSRYNLRSNNQRQTELYNVRNVKDFIVDYTQKVKHKKQILYQFLLDMYRLHKKYKTSTRKFAKIRARGENRA